MSKDIDFDSYRLTAVEIDRINHECKELDEEEQAIHEELCEE